MEEGLAAQADGGHNQGKNDIHRSGRESGSISVHTGTGPGDNTGLVGTPDPDGTTGPRDITAPGDITGLGGTPDLDGTTGPGDITGVGDITDQGDTTEPRYT